MSYDWKKIKEEIRKETQDVFSLQPTFSIDEALELFRKILEFPTNRPELKLDGLPDLLEAIERILIHNQISGDNFNAMALPFEAYLKKLLYLVNQPFYLANAHNITLGDKFDKNKVLIANGLIRELQLNPGNYQYWQRNMPVVKLIFDEHLWRAYNLRNSLAHFCTTYNRQQFWQGVQSYLVMYLYAAHKHKAAILQAVEPYFLSAYLQQYIADYQQWQTLFVPIAGIEFEKIEIWASEVPEEERPKQGQDNPEDDKKKPKPYRSSRQMRGGTVNELRRTIQERQMIVIAEPGMGKSTSLQYIAYTDAQAIEAGGTNMPYPVYLELKLFQQGDVVKQRIIQKLGIDAGVGEKLLAEGKITLLLDGLNEVAESNRNETIQAVKRFMEDYPDVFVLLTTRPNAYERYWFDNIRGRNKAPIFQLQEMGQQQIEEFLQKNSNNRATDTILKALETNPALKNIIKTPLLLKMLITNVSRQPNADIPPTETAIILAFLEGMGQWEQQQNETFNPTEFLERLTLLAHQSRMRNEANTALPEEEVLSILQNEAPKWELKALLKKATELRILAFDTGEKQYSFVHEIYQEALWAKQQAQFDKYLPAANSGIQYVPAIELWHKTGFKEALRLYSALLTGQKRFDFVREIGKRNVLLAARCKTACWHPEPDLQQMIVERAKLFAVFFEDAWNWSAQGFAALIELEDELSLVSLSQEYEKSHPDGTTAVLGFGSFVIDFDLAKYLKPIIPMSKLLKFISVIIERKVNGFIALFFDNIQMSAHDELYYLNDLKLISQKLMTYNLNVPFLILLSKCRTRLFQPDLIDFQKILETGISRFWALRTKQALEIIDLYELTSLLKSQRFIEKINTINLNFNSTVSHLPNIQLLYKKYNLSYEFLVDTFKKNIGSVQGATYTFEPLQDIDINIIHDMIGALTLYGYKNDIDYAYYLADYYDLFESNKITEIEYAISNGFITSPELQINLLEKNNLDTIENIIKLVNEFINDFNFSYAIKLIEKYKLFEKFPIVGLIKRMYHKDEKQFTDNSKYFLRENFFELIIEMISKYKLHECDEIADIVISVFSSQIVDNDNERIFTNLSYSDVKMLFNKFLQEENYSAAKGILIKYPITEKKLIKEFIILSFNQDNDSNNLPYGYIAASPHSFMLTFLKLDFNEDVELWDVFMATAIERGFIYLPNQIFQESALLQRYVTKILKLCSEKNCFNEPLFIWVLNNYKNKNYNLLIFNICIKNKQFLFAKKIVLEFEPEYEYKIILYEKMANNDLAMAYELFYEFNLNEKDISYLFAEALNHDLLFAKQLIDKHIILNEYKYLYFEKILIYDIDLAYNFIKEYEMEDDLKDKLIEHAILFDIEYFLILINRESLKIEKYREYITCNLINVEMPILFDRIATYLYDNKKDNYLQRLMPYFASYEKLVELYFKNISIDQLRGEFNKVGYNYYVYLSKNQHHNDTTLYEDFIVDILNGQEIEKIYSWKSSAYVEKILDGILDYLSNNDCQIQAKAQFVEKVMLSMDLFYKYKRQVCTWLRKDKLPDRFLNITLFLTLFSKYGEHLNVYWLFCEYEIADGNEVTSIILQAIEKGYIKTVKKWADALNLHVFCPPIDMVTKAIEMNETETARYWVQKYNLYSEFPQFEPPGEAAEEDTLPPEEA